MAELCNQLVRCATRVAFYAPENEVAKEEKHQSFRRDSDFVGRAAHFASFIAVSRELQCRKFNLFRCVWYYTKEPFHGFHNIKL